MMPTIELLKVTNMNNNASSASGTIEAVMSRGRPNAVLRGCFDCRHCRAAVSWWCTSDEAIERRGTAIPGTMGCPQWQPVRMLKDLGFFERLLGGAIRIKGEA